MYLRPRFRFTSWKLTRPSFLSRIDVIAPSDNRTILRNLTFTTGLSISRPMAAHEMPCLPSLSLPKLGITYVGDPYDVSISFRPR